MHYFAFKRNALYCENFKLKDLGLEFGTPLYIYSARTILEHLFKLKKALGKVNPLICYSVKANSNLSLLKLLVSKGAGLDIVSGGELYRAKKVNCPGERIVYASVGKTEREIKDAINYGILMFNVESLPELERIDSIAGRLKKRITVALRLNPDVESKTHRYVATGAKQTKFGMDTKTLRSAFLGRRNYSHLNLSGIHIHIGSQITESRPFIRAIKKAKELVEDLKRQGVGLSYLNIGGGLGIIYDKERPQTAQKFAGKVLPLLKGLSLKIILEPGRFIVGNAGVLLTRVIYIKQTKTKKFIIVDAAMNDLIRPALYGAYHKIVPVIQTTNYKLQTINYDIVGPICESGDFLGKKRKLNVEEGDYLAVLGAGAYGFSMSSNYNSRPKAAEVLVKDSKVHLIRRREICKDLIRNEIII